MIKRFSVLVLVTLLLLLGAASVLAQDGTPEVTPEATVEDTRSLSEIFASLPQSRAVDGGFVVGQPDAPITVIEFSDFACPHCQNYRPVIDQVIQQYVADGKAKFELRILPTAGGQLSYYAAQVMECSNHQRVGTFWQSYELLYDYAANGEYDENIGQRLSDHFELKYDKILNCVGSAQQVAKDTALAMAVGVMGTPAVLVRYGDGDPEFVTLEGREYSQGGVAFEVLAQVIEAANAPV